MGTSRCSLRGRRRVAVRLPLAQDPIGGFRQVARDRADRRRVPLPPLDARIEATDVLVRSGGARAIGGARRLDEGPLEVAIDVPPGRPVVGAAPAGVHPGRGAGIGGELRRAREAADVADLEPDDHRQDLPDPGERPEELQFWGRGEHRPDALLEALDLGRHDVQLLEEPLRREPAVRRQRGEGGGAEPLTSAPPEEIGRPLEPQAVLGERRVDPVLEAGALPGQGHAGAGEIPLIPERAGRDPDGGERPAPLQSVQRNSLVLLEPFWSRAHNVLDVWAVFLYS